MKISKVKLRDGGMKGLEVLVERYQDKGGVSFRVESREKRSAPVHRDLIKCFEWLEKYYLEALDKGVGDEVRVDWVQVKDGGYVLHGYAQVSSGELEVKTMVLNQESFKNYGELESVCRGLFLEAKEYMEEKKMMSVDEYVKKKEKENEEFNEKEYESMSKEEKLKVYVRLIEDEGGMVLMQDDIEIEEDTKVEPFTFNSNGVDVLSGKTTNTATINLDEAQVSPGFIEEPAKEKVLVKKGAPIDDLDFEI